MTYFLRRNLDHFIVRSNPIIILIIILIKCLKRCRHQQTDSDHFGLFSSPSADGTPGCGMTYRDMLQYFKITYLNICGTKPPRYESEMVRNIQHPWEESFITTGSLSTLPTAVL